MLCYAQPNKKESENGCTDGLGNRRDAVASLTEHPRKSKSAAPFPQYARLDHHGQTAFIINPDGNGWEIHLPSGVMLNPVTNRPFQHFSSAKKGAKYLIRKGKWPNKFAGRNRHRENPVARIETRSYTHTNGLT